MPGHRVVVGVPTFRRPGDLADLLPALLAQAADLPDHHVGVVVVDNDPQASGRAVVEALVAAGEQRIRYAVEPTPGIAAVRNRILDEAEAVFDADAVAMIDDDERPEPGWLAALVRTWEDTGAALVAGRVVPEFAGPIDPWIAAGRFFTRRNLLTGASITMAPAGNVLVDLKQARALDQRFDPAIGLAGGEDTLFSRSLHMKGAGMVWCADSIVVDRVPLERMTRRWVLTRQMSHGDATIRVRLRLARSRARRLLIRVSATGGGLGRIVVCSGRALLGVVLRRPVDQARGLRAAMRGVGMVRGAWGLHHEEYAREASGAPS